jgi:hypothetical protein
MCFGSRRPNQPGRRCRPGWRRWPPDPPTVCCRSTLGALAEKCHAYAKALHYKELEFQSSPHSAVEALISINNQLRQPDAAVGVLNVAQKELHMDLKESWCAGAAARVALSGRAGGRPPLRTRPGAARAMH